MNIQFITNRLRTLANEIEEQIEEEKREKMNNPCIGCKSTWYADSKTNCQETCDKLKEYKQANLIEWFAVYCGDEKFDLANKAEPIAYCQYEEHAKELIKKYNGLGYYRKLENGLTRTDPPGL